MMRQLHGKYFILNTLCHTHIKSLSYLFYFPYLTNEETGAEIVSHVVLDLVIETAVYDSRFRGV